MTTFEIVTTTKSVYNIQTGELLCSELIKQHTSLKDILRDLGVQVDTVERSKYLKALNMLNEGIPLSKVVSQIVGGGE
ncbi:hypothetical protein CWC14_06560 [Pseudoalteromonas sp. S3260]|jgi:hypothetical protein|uniref:hypothetical protein n=1 Tax=Pseudoalteromonas sp. S3260 TaxID=579534 RepID=UPI00110BFFCE|nr:hypothetical protein [Pseudoalteromonas sp. S3260]TMO98427.1 hypothetical protein CWC14_06560 [Pseudoalteromonas sp. S3260]